METKQWKIKRSGVCNNSKSIKDTFLKLHSWIDTIKEIMMSRFFVNKLKMFFMATETVKPGSCDYSDSIKAT